MSKITTKKIEADVAVIGSGIAGTMVAYQLASKGKRVALLEKGKLVGADLIKSVYEEESFIGHSQVPCLPVEICKPKKSNLRYLPKVVGGLARFYAGVSLRMREEEFAKWPYEYSEIEPYYSQAEQLMSVSGIPGKDPFDPWRSRPYPFCLPTQSGLSKRLSEGAEMLGMRPFQHPFAIRFENQCVRCNFCNQVPCAYGAKWSPDRLLLENRQLPISLFEGLRAERITFSGTGSGRKAQSIQAISEVTGESFEVFAENFVIAGGALFTSRLLQDSGLADENPHIGRNLMTHCLALVVGIFPFRISEENDFHKWWSVSDYYFDLDGSVRGLIQQDHLTTRKKIHDKVPGIFHWAADALYYRTCQLLIIAEDDPCPANRVEKGVDGKGGLRVVQNFSAKDVERREFLVAKARSIMKRAGAVATLRFEGQSVYHACGTARMGRSPESSVTDSGGRLWGCNNLYVADASLMPTSSGVNPSLTIAAMALKVSDKIV